MSGQRKDRLPRMIHRHIVGYNPPSYFDPNFTHMPSSFELGRAYFGKIVGNRWSAMMAKNWRYKTVWAGPDVYCLVGRGKLNPNSKGAGASLDSKGTKRVGQSSLIYKNNRGGKLSPDALALFLQTGTVNWEMSCFLQAITQKQIARNLEKKTWYVTTQGWTTTGTANSSITNLTGVLKPYTINNVTGDVLDVNAPLNQYVGNKITLHNFEFFLGMRFALNGANAANGCGRQVRVALVQLYENAQPLLSDLFQNTVLPATNTSILSQWRLETRGHYRVLWEEMVDLSTDCLMGATQALQNFSPVTKSAWVRRDSGFKQVITMTEFDNPDPLTPSTVEDGGIYLVFVPNGNIQFRYTYSMKGLYTDA